jgi:hypothetical protein
VNCQLSELFNFNRFDGHRLDMIDNLAILKSFQSFVKPSLILNYTIGSSGESWIIPAAAVQQDQPV